MTTPESILSEARTWLGTRFHHQGRVKANVVHKGGCDCLGLIAGVAAALDLQSREGLPLASYDTTDYGRAPDGGKLRETLARCLHEMPPEEIRPADVLLFRFEEEPQHVGLVSCHPEPQAKDLPLQGILHCVQDDSLTIIHCYASARKVVEHRLDDLWRSRIVAAYRFPDISG